MISQKHSRAGLLAGACAVALFAGPALAAPQAAPVEAAAADSEAPAPETEGLQEIVVTATKRETNLQKPRSRSRC